MTHWFGSSISVASVSSAKAGVALQLEPAKEQQALAAASVGVELGATLEQAVSEVTH
jgi:hypothetical protein